MPTSTRQTDRQEGGSYYTADHIRDEKRGRVLVVWSGKDAKTGLPYEPSWVCYRLSIPNSVLRHYQME
ncbi:hypothetical protein LIPSTDRAFT_68225 [Lipomyces starkeyi NRRL Y-11557]|uniref:Uncharacterized protein n=1 Tax=Lipomyces starkeyi NRRL Y-11557 TaxID=675824 RepID=A0A1E3QF22_LIPST|nr:hypothetical protein LIPSTDRAFT_68225 [Lipomyces starkeyi NRRL Y-11557]